MNRQLYTVAILTTLSVLSFAIGAKAEPNLNGASIPDDLLEACHCTSLADSTVDHTHSSVQSNDFPSLNLEGVTLNGASLDGSTVDHTQLSVHSEDFPNLSLEGVTLNGTSLDGSTVDHTQPFRQADDSSNLDFQQNDSLVNETANQANVTANE